MSKKDRNKEIVDEFNQVISDRGLAGKLKVDPISNTFKRRQHFTTKADGTSVFTAFMWQMNDLQPDECSAEIKRHIDSAVKHFGIEEDNA